MAEAITVARPYAQAAFEEARELGELKSWSDILQSVAQAVINPEVRAIITSPRIIKSQLVDLMLALSGGKVSEIQRNFIKLLIEGQRLTLLPEIVMLFEVMRAEAEKNVDVVVTSAFDLSEAQKQKITVALKKRMGREIRLSCETDRKLLGGIIIRAGDKVIDGSARTHLSELANALA
ncbi:F0F1 ATP synthase subunit delta [Candidatus Nitrotoga sp. 1052]|uniref:F0F1 ATP synthase subunit delta n=1 Tax=Candidatus Nitrotoga sp. 1052 TaxID=2886964 RepID=UPI001EF568F3|nr:F0F1 ATP synthase subunit delta [Candidatus Nitrotoga sp. 1052]CAH1076264.1 ATP synthase subunit delta [Candidatus Nitrotoga sp. 1052]